ncbi:hypothetical protein HDU87_001144 [Geranomyces variabilis]|uniref:Uncharacterized protein n=1 Tax=Geranomyces variabilis TaxID=109894 RepID=A0AAD5XIB3_9FUNG|nr:hypothetical protein HDU87_001144 [Geranomyces variabilis]
MNAYNLTEDLSAFTGRRLTAQEQAEADAVYERHLADEARLAEDEAAALEEAADPYFRVCDEGLDYDAECDGGDCGKA